MTAEDEKLMDEVLEGACRLCETYKLSASLGAGSYSKGCRFVVETELPGRLFPDGRSRTGCKRMLEPLEGV